MLKQQNLCVGLIKSSIFFQLTELTKKYLDIIVLNLGPKEYMLKSAIFVQKNNIGALLLYFCSVFKNKKIKEKRALAIKTDEMGMAQHHASLLENQYNNSGISVL